MIGSPASSAGPSNTCICDCGKGWSFQPWRRRYDWASAGRTERIRGSIQGERFMGILPPVYLRRVVVSKKKAKAATEEGRPQRRKLSAEESLQRMKEFDKRKEAFIAALRKSKDRG